MSKNLFPIFSLLVLVVAVATQPLAALPEKPTPDFTSINLVKHLRRLETLPEKAQLEIAPKMVIEGVTMPGAFCANVSRRCGVPGVFPVVLRVRALEACSSFNVSVLICGVEVCKRAFDEPLGIGERRKISLVLNMTNILDVLLENAAAVPSEFNMSFLVETGGGCHSANVSVPLREVSYDCKAALNSVEAAVAYLNESFGHLSGCGDVQARALAATLFSLTASFTALSSLNLSAATFGVENAGELAAAVLTAVALGELPLNFSGLNYEGALLERVSTEELRADEAAWALLALSAVNGSKAYETRAEIAEGLRRQLFQFLESVNESGTGDLTAAALAVQALISAGVSSKNSTLHAILGLLRAEQNDDGGFPFEFGGGESDALPTALVTAALLVADDAQAKPNITSSVEYLLSMQDADGSFLSYDPVRATALAALTLLGQGLPTFRQFVFEQELPEILLLNIYVSPYLNETWRGESVAYANVTCGVFVSVRNNGGAFNVSLLADGEPVSELRVLESRALALTNVSFMWRPSHVGVFNLTALVDVNNEINERNETNNAASLKVSVELPDLSLRLLPELPLLFSNFTNEIPLEVVGFGENFNISFFASASATTNPTTAENAMNESAPNNGNATSATAYAPCERLENVTCYGRKNVTLRWRPNVTGVFNFTLTVDADDDVFESDEANNKVCSTLSVSLPDIYVANFSVSRVVVVNVSNAVNLVVGGVAEHFNVSIYCRRFRDENGSVTNDTWGLIEKLHVRRVFGVANFSFSWTPTEPGIYALATLLDADKDVFETDENNNTAFFIVKAVLGAPNVQLLFPRGGEVLSGVISVRWVANDPDGDALNITLKYSPDMGRNWLLLSENKSNDGVYVWDTKAVPDGKYLLRVEASDGRFTSYDETVEPFFVHNVGEEPSQYQGGDAGFYASEAPDKFEIAWETADIGAVPSSKVCIGNNKVFAYCDNASGTFLTALDAGSGEILWQTPLEKRSSYGSWASPVYYDNRVYIGSGSTVYCIDAESGNVQWQQRLEGDIVNSCPSIAKVGDHRTLLVIGKYGAAGDPAFYCFNAKSGERLWVFDRSDEPRLECGRATSTAALSSGKVYVGIGAWQPEFTDTGIGIYCLDAESGEQLWNASTDYGVWGSVTLVHGTLFFGTYNLEDPGDAAYYAMSPANGRVFWSRSGISTNSVPAYAFGYIYICGGCPGYSPLKTYCLDPESGATVWDFPEGGWTISPAVSSDGKVLIGTLASGEALMNFDTAGVYCLNAFTGKEIWNSSRLGGSSPAIYGGRVYTSGQGKVYAFGPSALPDINVSVEVASGVVFAGLQNYVGVTVRNEGSGDVNESFTVTLRVEGETVSTLNVEPPLHSGKNRTLTFNWTPPLELAGMTVRLVAEADAENNVTEKDPFNNIAFEDVSIKLPPDLIVSDVELERASVGVKCIVEAFVENVGGADADAFNVGFRVMHAGAELENVTVRCDDGLEVGKGFTTTFEWTPPLPGVYTLVVEADASHEVQELDEGNNVFELNVTVSSIETPTPQPSPATRGGGGRGSKEAWNYTIPTVESEAPVTEGLSGSEHPPVNMSNESDEKQQHVTGIPFGEILPKGGIRSKLSVVFVTAGVLAMFAAVGFLWERRKHKNL